MSPATMRELVAAIRTRGGVVYLEVVSTTSDAVVRSLEAGNALGVDCILGGTDLAAAARVLGDLSRYFPFPGRPIGHPTPARRQRRSRGLALRARIGRRLRRRGPSGVQGHAGQTAGPRARGARRADRGPPHRRGQRHDSRADRSARRRGCRRIHRRFRRVDGGVLPAKGALRSQVRELGGSCADGQDRRVRRRARGPTPYRPPFLRGSGADAGRMGVPIAAAIVIEPGVWKRTVAALHLVTASPW